MQYTYWDGSPTKVHGGLVIDTTWDQMKTRFTSPARSEHKGADGGWTAATFTTDHRKDEYVDKVTFLVLDHDAGEVSIQSAAESFDAYSCIVHATHRSRPEAHRWRAIFALTRPMTRAEHTRVWKDVAGNLQQHGVTLDVSTKNASRYWYSPVVCPGVPYEYVVSDGALLDVDALLSRPEPIRRPSRYEPGTAKGERYAHRVLERAARNVACANEGERNPMLNKEVWSVARFEELPTHVIVEAFTSAAKACGLGDIETRKTIASALKSRSR